jgi:hypothetical protein
MYPQTHVLRQALKIIRGLATAIHQERMYGALSATTQLHT